MPPVLPLHTLARRSIGRECPVHRLSAQQTPRMAQHGAGGDGGPLPAPPRNRLVPAVSPRRPFRGLPSTGRQIIVISHIPHSSTGRRLRRGGQAVQLRATGALASPAVATPQRAAPARSSASVHSEAPSQGTQSTWNRDPMQAASEYARRAMASPLPPSPRWHDRSLPSVSPRVSHTLASATLGPVDNRDEAVRSTNMLRTRSGVFGCYGAASAAMAHRMAIGASRECVGDMALPLARDCGVMARDASSSLQHAPDGSTLPLLPLALQPPPSLPSPPIDTWGSKHAHSSRRLHRPQINRVEDSPYGRPTPRVRIYRPAGHPSEGQDAGLGSTAASPSRPRLSGAHAAALSGAPSSPTRLAQRSPGRGGGGSRAQLPRRGGAGSGPLDAAPAVQSPAQQERAAEESAATGSDSHPPGASTAAETPHGNQSSSADAPAKPASGSGDAGKAPNAAAMMGAVAAVTRSRARARRKLGLFGRVKGLLSGGDGQEEGKSEGNGGGDVAASSGDQGE